VTRWVWTTHADVRERRERLGAAPENGHLRMVRMRSRGEMDRFLAVI